MQTTIEKPALELNGTPPGKKVKIPETDIITQIRHAGRSVLKNVVVTPIIAEKLLKFNVNNNRAFSKRAVNVLATAMSAGKWFFNGDAIRFTKSMKLIDGQHRLLAVIESGTTQTFNIQCGLSEEAFATIDVGKKRTAGDTLSVAGIRAYQNITAAAIKAVIYFRTKQSVGAKITGIRVDNQTMLEWTNQTTNMKAMLEAVDYAVKEYHAVEKFLAQSTWAFLHYILSKINKEDAWFFLNTLATGEDISRTRHSSIYLLRRKLSSNKLLTEGSKPMETRIKYVMTAWNHFRSNEEIQELVIEKKNPVIPKPI